MMTRNEIENRADNLANKARRDGSIAIFYVGGKFKSIGVKGGLAQHGFSQNIDCLMGVYDHNVEESWIADDMIYMQSRA